MNAEVSKHDMQDTYLPAFRAAVIEGKAGSVMCAYNRVNGEPACANSYLLENQLRGAWKFDGYVVGDCDSVEEIFSAHHFTKTFAEAGALALKRGWTMNASIPNPKSPIIPTTRSFWMPLPRVF